MEEEKMRKVVTHEWDATKFLKTDEDIAGFIDAAIEEGDPDLLQHALGIAAKAKGMMKVSKETGLSRGALYRALDKDGNPTLASFFKILKALDLKMTIKPAN
ncbi:MAG: putative addiction module antidote protein [Bifidobacteriaceae bacterium]|nr:putative addiction module antidote protein [Bifidobacteriaceae bacterium]MCI1914837.1 putative addiction module antidote protein [Bifidobacteriaceae bacterium]